MNDILRQAIQRLREAGIDSPRAEARMLWEHAQKKLSLSPIGGEGWGEGGRGGQKPEIRSRKWMEIRSESDFGSAASDFSSPPHPDPFPLPQRGRGDSLFEALLQRRLRQEPMAYIAGRKEFWSLDFAVGPGVLIPRPESETLVEVALAELPERNEAYRVLDLGTGSGCLLAAFLTERPNAAGIGIDSSGAALEWARRNVRLHGLDERVQLARGGWEAAEGSFDLILSNPPYIPTEDIPGLPPDVRDYEPKAALDGGADGLDAYRALAPVLRSRLRPGGLAVLETGAGQHHLVRQILEIEGLAVPCIAKDLAGIPRAVIVRSAGQR